MDMVNAYYRFKVIQMDNMFWLFVMVLAFLGLMIALQAIARSYLTPEVYPNFGRFVL